MLNTTIDVASVRRELPVVTKHIHMNTASFGPLLRCVPPAIEAWLQKECQERVGMEAYLAMGKLYTEARSLLASFFNASSDEVALTGNTGEGLNIVCRGLDWQAGDEVIITEHEHVSVHVLLSYLRDRYGVVIRIAEVGPSLYRPVEDAIAELITPRTRLVLLSHVSCMTGAVLNVRAVAELAHRFDIPVLVDGAQSAGVVPIDVKELQADFYAIPMQKWLCGPDGAGALYVRREARERLNMTYIGGWFTLTYKALRAWDFQDAAQRFELGGRHTAGVAGQIAALRWLEDVATFPWVYERISFLNRYLCDAVKSIADVTVLTPEPGASGLLAFRLADQDAGPIVPWLQREHDIHIRAVFEYNALRVSTCFFNTEEEIERLVQALRAWK
jgi:L-cysteine/cystine lyase